MQPCYNDGDLVVVSPFPSLRTGDTIIFDVHNSLVIHRIFEFKEKEMLTKGDANNSVDPWVVHADQIIGKVCFRVPKIGAVIRLFQAKGGILCPN
jgi:signal peptidase I